MPPTGIRISRFWSRKSILGGGEKIRRSLGLLPVVLVLPCGRSAHTEAGWFAGRGLKTIVYMPGKQEPELMYKLFDRVVGNLDELVDALC